MKKVVKGGLLIGALLFYLGVCSIIFLFSKNESIRRKAVSHWNHQFAPVLQSILGIEVWIQSQKVEKTEAGTLFLSNHLSFLDIIVLSVLYPTVFVTSTEVKHSTPWGWIASLGGCLFVERRNKSTLMRDLKEISETLQSGINIVLFPEGTSSNGQSVLPFKNSLLEVAFQSESSVAIQPLCLNYRWCDGFPVTASHGKDLFYFGEMTLWEQLNRVFEKDEIGVEVQELPALQSAAIGSRKKVGELAFQSISKAYIPLV